MNPNISSVTNVAGEVKPQTDWIESNYHINLGGDRSNKEPQQLPNLKRQPIKRKQHKHPKEIAAEQKLKEANAKDLNKRNLN